VAVAAGLLGCALASAPAAEATYPGRNGRIAFNSSESVGEFQVLRANAIRPDGTGRRELGDFAFPSWSASGRRLVAIAYPVDHRTGERARLVFADRRGSVRRAIPLPDTVRCDWAGCTPLEPNVAIWLRGEAPALSPDGRTVAFVNEFDLPNSQPQTVARWIWTVRTDGGRLRRLRAGTRPRWTPDGRRIVFQSWDELGSIEEVASMRPDGTRVRPLLTDERVVEPELLDVAPDGRRLLWRGRLRRPNGSQASWLFRSHLSGRRAHVVDGSGLYPPDASWSPDGTKIVFSREGRGRATWIVPATGGRARRLLPRPHQALAWQPLPDPGQAATQQPRLHVLPGTSPAQYPAPPRTEGQ